MMLAIEISKALLLGFIVGLTGALVPGPMLFATIEVSLKKGWLAGPEVVFGHILVELVLSVLILFGAASFIGSGTISAISVIGGLSLVVFGLLTVKGAKAVAFAGVSPGTSCTSGLKLTSNPIHSTGPDNLRFKPLFLDLVAYCGQCACVEGK